MMMIRRTHDTASGNGSKALPNHAANGARHHCGDHAIEESLLGEIGVMSLEKFTRRLVEL